jgi:hypothetical protein
MLNFDYHGNSGTSTRFLATQFFLGEVKLLRDSAKVFVTGFHSTPILCIWLQNICMNVLQNQEFENKTLLFL